MQFCPETRIRIKVAVAAYAYEVMDDPIMSDAEFDRLARAIRPSVTKQTAVLARLNVDGRLTRKHWRPTGVTSIS